MIDILYYYFNYTSTQKLLERETKLFGVVKGRPFEYTFCVFSRCVESTRNYIG